MPSQIGSAEVLSIMENVGAVCKKEIRVYMVGGGAMALRGEKDATKDIDLIVRSQAEARELQVALESLGFEVNARHPRECHALVDATILSTPTGLRADVFIGKICNKLRLSEGMIRRAELVDKWGGITLYICSREDIFLLKSVTERSRDLDDMITLFRKGLDRDIILGECEAQADPEGLRHSNIWEAFLLTKVEEMEKRHGVRVPWKRGLRSRAETKLGAQHLLRLIEGGANSVKDLTTDMAENPQFVGRCLRHLEENREIEIDRSVRPHRIRLLKRTLRGDDARVQKQ